MRFPSRAREDAWNAALNLQKRFSVSGAEMLLRDVYDKDHNLHDLSGKDERRPFRAIAYRPQEDEYVSSELHLYATRYITYKFWDCWHVDFLAMLQLPRYLADDMLQTAYEEMVKGTRPPSGSPESELNNLMKEKL